MALAVLRGTMPKASTPWPSGMGRQWYGACFIAVAGSPRGRTTCPARGPRPPCSAALSAARRDLIVLVAVGLLAVGAFPPAVTPAPGGARAAQRPVPDPLEPRLGRASPRGLPGDAGGRAWRRPQHPGGLCAPTSRISPASAPGAAPAPAAAGADLLRAYLRRLADLGLKPRTAARRLSALRQFYRFLAREGVRPDDPTELLEGPKPTPPPAQADHRGGGRGAARRRRQPARPSRQAGGGGDRVALLRRAPGQRAGGLPAAALRPDPPLIAVRGKGGRERLVPISRARRARRRGAARAEANRAEVARRRRGRMRWLFPLARRLRPHDAAGTRAAAEGGGDAAGLGRNGSARMCCGIPSPATCWRAAPISAACRSCWAMPISPPPRSTPR